MESAPQNEKRENKFLPTSSGKEAQMHEFPVSHSSEKMNRRESQELFASAQASLVSEKNFKRFVNAIKDKETTGSNEGLTFLQNFIIQQCVNLSERDVELLVDQFNRSVRDWFVKSYSSSQIDARVYDSIVSGRYTHGQNNIDVRGIQNVISFIKARAVLLESDPALEYSFYFNEKLDARYSIDVIEEIETAEGPIVSLIQLKSSNPSEEEVESIHADHKRWLEEEWMSLEDYERSYKGEGSVEETEKFFANMEQVREALFEFATDPESKSVERLLSSLHLSNLSNRQKMWCLWKYSNLIREELDIALGDGTIDEETFSFVKEEFLKIEEELVKKTKVPKSQLEVYKIKSTIAVGPKVVSEREMETSGNGKIINLR